MNVNINNIPFSRDGAYVALTAEGGSLIIHNVRSRPFQDRALEMYILKEGRAVNYQIEAFPEYVRLISPEGEVTLYIRDDETIAFDSHGLDLYFKAMDDASPGSYGIEDGDHAFRIIETGIRLHILFVLEKGSGSMTGRYVNTGVWQWNGAPVNHKNEFSVSCQDGRILGAVKLSAVESPSIPLPIETQKEISVIKAEWETFLGKMPPTSHKTDEELEFNLVTWYNLWSSYVHARDIYRNDVMVMSKKTMTAVWSWDHCFNALAMAGLGPKEALDQFMAPFYLQNENGALPDLLNPGMELLWNFTKPPVHGWCFGKLMDKFEYPNDILKTVYDGLEKQLNWWFVYRDEDHNGLPCYAHGNDSGWDNSSLFDNGYYVTAPDLSAYIFLQMRTLSRIAGKLKMSSEKTAWEEKSSALLQNLFNLCWKEDHFVALRSHGRDYVPFPSSLQTHLPVVLGEYLGDDKMAVEVATLKNRFLTEYGLATEAPDSPRYESDGYWRGPIWAPSTYIIVDGLRRGGYPDFAESLARRYIHLSANVARGNYENFDALTGKGFRAPGYTWSASVYMLLKWEYPL
jgi:hypothetical protein